MKSDLSPETAMQWHLPAACWLLVGLSVAMSGCATNRYYATDLPPRLIAPHLENPKTIDLSKLAVPTSKSDLIDAGDVLEVTISAGLSQQDVVTRPVRVNENGIATLPYLGSLQLSGLDFEGAEAVIMNASIDRGLYRTPFVTVTMKQQRTNRITVIGAVENPGIVEVPRGSSDLLAAIVAAGGLAKDAGVNVEIKHSPTAKGGRLPPIADGSQADTVTPAGLAVRQASQPNTVKVNLISAVQNTPGGIPVEDGSVITVERRDPKPLHVIGLVRKPGRYDFPFGEDVRVLDAVALASGVNNGVADKVFVLRKLDGMPQPEVIQVSLREAKQDGKANLKLAPGDVVSVEQTPSTVLLETVKLIRFAVGASMGTLF